MVWCNFGLAFFLCRELLSGKSPASVEISCEQEISTGVSLPLWLGKLYVCRKMKEAWVYLIFKPVTKVLLLNNSGTFTWSRIPYGLDGYITSIFTPTLSGMLRARRLHLHCGNPSFFSKINSSGPMEDIHRLLIWWQTGNEEEEGSLQILTPLSGPKVQPFPGRRQFGSNSPFPDAISYYGLLCLGSSELEIGWDSFTPTHSVSFVGTKRRAMSICSLAAPGHPPCGTKLKTGWE